MNIINFDILILPLLGLFMSFAFFPISAFPLIITLGIFSFIIKKVDKYLKLYFFGFLFGYGFFLIQTYWIFFSFYQAYKNIEWLVPYLSIFAPMPFACIVGVLSMVTGSLKKRPIYYINFSFLWTLSEYIRNNIYFSFNCGLLGYTMADVPYFNNLLSYIGPYGLGLLISLLSVSIFFKNKKYIISNLFLLIFICIAGKINKKNNYIKFNKNKFEKIRIVQPSIKEPHYQIFDKQINIYMILSRLTFSSGFNDIQYTFWPEAVFPHPIANNSKFIVLFKYLLSRKLTPSSLLIFGVDNLKTNGNKFQCYNSIVVLNDQGGVLDIYNKRVLVPFGEYIPYKNFDNIIPRIVYSLNSEDALKGGNKNITAADNRISFLPLLCSESILNKSYLSLLSFYRYRFILNISNDSWFKNTFGIYHHYASIKIKAIKYGLPAIRIANTGLSAIISVYGDVIKANQINKGVIIDAIVPYQLNKPTTYYILYEYIMPFIFIYYIMYLLLFLIF